MSGGTGFAGQSLEEPRPPGALTEPDFSDRCLCCGDCAAVCPANAIRLDRHKYPVLAKPAQCRQCGLCADVCSHGAIELNARTGAGLAFILEMERRRGF